MTDYRTASAGNLKMQAKESFYSHYRITFDNNMSIKLTAKQFLESIKGVKDDYLFDKVIFNIGGREVYIHKNSI